MKLLVCIKQILDPEIPVRDFSIDREKLEADSANANQVTNIFCENALETALQLRDSVGESSITVICFGRESAEDSLRKALAMKADEACLVMNDLNHTPDSATTAHVLASAIESLGSFDLIFTGRESGDWGNGQTGAYLAEELKVPYLPFVDDIKQTDKGFEVRRQTESGWERYGIPASSVVTITNSDHNLPRIPKTRDIMMSHRKTITRVSFEDLKICKDELNPQSDSVRPVKLFVPEKESACEFIEGENLNAKIDQLADKIMEIRSTL